MTRRLKQPMADILGYPSRDLTNSIPSFTKEIDSM